MITAEQMRAARALLRMEQSALAEMSGISLATIKRMEAMPGDVRGQEATIAAVKKTLEAQGIDFIGANEESKIGGAGVRLAERAAEPTEEHIEWVLSRLREIQERHIRGVSKENIREAMGQAFIEAFEETQAGFGWEFKDPENKLFQNAFGIAVSRFIGTANATLNRAPEAPKPPRVRYNRSNPEAGSKMKQGSNLRITKKTMDALAKGSDDDES